MKNDLQIEYKDGDDSKNGCLKRYACCKTEENNPTITGCEDRYDCCKKSFNSEGCTKVNQQSQRFIKSLD